jgi:hypothetical protein
MPLIGVFASYRATQSSKMLDGLAPLYFDKMVEYSMTSPHHAGVTCWVIV